MLHDDIYHARVLVNREGRTTHHPAGRFFVKDGMLRHLEDHHGLLQQTIPEGVVDDYTISRVKNPGPHLMVASDGEVRRGERLDMVPEAQLHRQMKPEPQPTPEEVAQHVASAPRPPSVWDYKRAGHDRPHVLEARAGRFTLDGNVLAPDEARAVLNTVRTKGATLRYRRAGDAVAKMEAALRKAEDDMSPSEALAYLEQMATASGDERGLTSVARARRHMFEDPRAPGVGNKYAWEDFRGKAQPGTYVSADLNNFKQVNDIYGHEAGDAAIRAFGRAMREAADEVGTEHSKVFMPGGDEGVGHFRTPEHAAVFVRKLQEKLDQVPPVGGTHRVTVSSGIGPDFSSADRALRQAKGQKFHPVPAGALRQPQPRFAPGQVPHLSHSLVPGHEGAVPQPGTSADPSPQPRAAG